MIEMSQKLDIGLCENERLNVVFILNVTSIQMCLEFCAESFSIVLIFYSNKTLNQVCSLDF